MHRFSTGSSAGTQAAITIRYRFPSRQCCGAGSGAAHRHPAAQGPQLRRPRQLRAPQVQGMGASPGVTSNCAQHARSRSAPHLVRQPHHRLHARCCSRRSWLHHPASPASLQSPARRAHAWYRGVMHAGTIDMRMHACRLGKCQIRLRPHLVVVAELLAPRDGALGVDDDVLCALHRHRLGVAVRLAAVVDEARLAALQRPSAPFQSTLDTAYALPGHPPPALLMLVLSKARRA